jgi:RNA polymerase sigma-70 factor, ECF subfamily
MSGGSLLLHRSFTVTFPLVTKLPADIDDVELMRLVSEQNSGALAELYDRHSTIIFSVLMQMLADPAESQDILHDVFLKLQRKSTAYDPTLGRPVAWLLTMARNTALDKLRRRSTHQRYVTKLTIEAEPMTLTAGGLHHDEIEQIHQCVGSLPDDQKNTLELAYFGGLTQQQIATELAQPLGTVKARIRRGLLKLRDCLEGRL